jgi:peroxiredoxin
MRFIMSLFKTYLPDVIFHLRERDESIGGDNPYKWVRKTTGELMSGKKVLIFGLPGAFTPTCTNEQLPAFERLYDEFIAEGFDEIYCTSVNDAFVMNKWAKDLGIEKVKMLPDGSGQFAKAAGYLVDKSNLGFGLRSWRYAIVVEDMSIERWFDEDGMDDLCPADPYEESNPEHILKTIRSAN